MKKTELIKKVAERTGSTIKDTGKILNSTLEVITEELSDKKSDGKVIFTGWGTFERRKNKARNGINPQTKKPIKIKARNVARFKAGKKLKDAVAKK